MGAHPLGRMVCMILIAALLWQAPWSGGARAAMVTTETVLDAQDDPGAGAAARARLLALLQRDRVRAEFEALGIDPDEAIARVESLSDPELAGLLGRIDSLPAGTGGLCDDGTPDPVECLVYGGALVITIVFLVLVVVGLAVLLAYGIKALVADSPETTQTALLRPLSR